MSLLENILYGFVSGITEFLPVSSRAHQALLRYLFGVSNRSSFQELLIHIGLLLSIVVSCREILFRLRREQKAQSGPRRRRGRLVKSKSLYDLRLLKTATVPLLVGLLLTVSTVRFENNLLTLMGFLLFNALILLVVEHMRHGNRDARTMSGLDGIVMGVVGALSVFPGVSRTGMISAYATARGADTQSAANWTILLGIPAIFFAACYDIFGIASNGFGVASVSVAMGYVLSGVAAFGGGYVGISVLQLVLSHSGFSKFAYYSIGAALFSFMLYLIT